MSMLYGEGSPCGPGPLSILGALHSRHSCQDKRLPCQPRSAVTPHPTGACLHRLPSSPHSQAPGGGGVGQHMACGNTGGGVRTRRGLERVICARGYRDRSWTSAGRVPVSVEMLLGNPLLRACQRAWACACGCAGLWFPDGGHEAAAGRRGGPQWWDWVCCLVALWGLRCVGVICQIEEVPSFHSFLRIYVENGC